MCLINSFINLLGGIPEQSWEHHAEEWGCQCTALFQSIAHWEGYGSGFSVIQHTSHHADVKLMLHGDELVRTTVLSHNLETLPANSVKGLFKVSKGDIEAPVLFLNWYLSWSCLAIAMKIMSTIPLPAQRPHCLSVRWPLSRWAEWGGSGGL